MKRRGHKIADKVMSWVALGLGAVLMLVWLPAGTAAALEWPAKLCSDGNRSGRCSEITKSIPNISSLPVGNDAVSSLSTGMQDIIIYEDFDYKGGCEYISAWTTDDNMLDNFVYNDRVSSVWVVKNDGKDKKCEPWMELPSWELPEDFSLSIPEFPETPESWGPETFLGELGCAAAYDDRCWFHALKQYEETGDPIRGSHILNNCIPDGTRDLTQTITETVTVGTTLTTTHDETLQVGGGGTASTSGGKTGPDGQVAIPTAALNFSISKTWHDGRSTQVSESTATSQAETLTVPPGQVGWLEFYPQEWVSNGYMKGDTGGWSWLQPGRIFYYPEDGSDGLQARSPIKLSNGKVDGYWKPGYAPCKYEVKGKASSKMLDVENRSQQDLARVEIRPASDEFSQEWIFRRNGNGTFQIVNSASGKCLDIYEAESGDGTPVIQYSCTGGSNQRWRVKASGTAFQIVSAMNSKCLEVFGGTSRDGDDVAVWSCNGGDHQKWLLAEPDSWLLRDDIG
ncbi:hypothetical protein SSP24_78900 [Streptomyces spinoverrucosus]|uniref:Ricin B lectin domain-containing protein n=1 Tax=Streptomyces spinoverrucosus TaxID=284043 RepID=A0A4Y3VVT3_9ACTN|nr:RICIN domain-containing protein [Streptomyces spinoverrucosus]GEC10235.1 hypothetical protein SSP24_78900 [Streptomyces spinoverrucosus]GHB96305.1 hypothetical protein GCM10010397_81180 [Streptomyces spinoverrucosus]